MNLTPTAKLLLNTDFLNLFVARSTDKKQDAKLGASTLQQCSGNNRIKLCRKGFSTTTDEISLCLASFFCTYDVPSVRNCKVEFIFLPDAPQAFHLEDGMYHVVSRHPALRMKNDSRLAGCSISTFTYQACIVRPSCSSTLSFYQGDLVLTPDMDFCENHQLPFIASILLTPFLDQVFKHVPPAASQFHVYLVVKALQSVLNSARMDSVELLDVKCMSPDALDQHTKPIADYYFSITPATSAALSSYLPICTAICFSLTSITVSLLTFCVSFTLFLRQWRHSFLHPQQFFCGTSGRFLHIVDPSPPTLDSTDSSFCTFLKSSFVLYRNWLKKPFVDPFLLIPFHLLTVIVTLILTPILTHCSISFHQQPPSNSVRVYLHITAPIYHIYYS